MSRNTIYIFLEVDLPILSKLLYKYFQNAMSSSVKAQKKDKKLESLVGIFFATRGWKGIGDAFHFNTPNTIFVDSVV